MDPLTSYTESLTNRGENRREAFNTSTARKADACKRPPAPNEWFASNNTHA